MTEKRRVRIQVPVLARVEGEGALNIQINGDEIEQLSLNIFEPPRLFEKLLEGREFHEVPDMVARICGICPVAYQMTAVQALEQIFDLEPSEWVKRMRRLFYCGEWIQSHALHIHLLAAPDLLGFESAPAMASKFSAEVRRGLRLQSIGNDIIKLLGARSVHPVGARVGGFFQAPKPEAVQNLVTKLEDALIDAEALVTWCASLDIPNDRQEFVSVALSHPDEYAIDSGRLVSSGGLDISVDQYEAHFTEFQIPHSTALYSALHDQCYLVGPLARLNLNHHRLPDSCRSLLQSTGLKLPSANMFHSIVARAIEIHFAITEALRLLQDYHLEKPFTEVSTSSGTGYGCTEAPRGTLWHKYQTENNGNIQFCRIVPPTSQNQARIEQDIAASLKAYGLHHSDGELRLRAETVIRNYDPCISCATHFLKLKVDRQ